MRLGGTQCPGEKKFSFAPFGLVWGEHWHFLSTLRLPVEKKRNVVSILYGETKIKEYSISLHPTMTYY
jgi:hypothetical protein